MSDKKEMLQLCDEDLLPTKMQHTCNICDKYFTLRKNLLRHGKNQHASYEYARMSDDEDMLRHGDENLLPLLHHMEIQNPISSERVSMSDNKEMLQLCDEHLLPTEMYT